MTEAQSSLNAVLDEFEQSKLMSAGKCVSTLLKCLAYYPELRKAVEGCTKNFDYEKAFSHAAVNFGTHASFNLPENPRRQVGLCVCLFSEFDLAKRDLMKFVFDFFPAETRQDSYAAFLEGVVKPFKAAINAVLEGKAVSDGARRGEEELSAVNEGVTEQANFVVLNMVDVIRGASLEDAERAECMTVLEGFALAVDMRDSVLLKTVWIGLKNTLARYRLCAKQLKELEKILKDFAVM